jgi:hypothetical protein
MAAFGTGLGADPLAAARQAEFTQRRAQRQRDIERLGKDQNAFGKGVTALSVVGGEKIGSALAGAFGMETPDSPEVAAARSQAKLLENINLIEGDTSSADYAKQAARLAMEAGDQATAFQFAQEAGTREKAETALAVKTEDARVKTLAENFGRQPNSMKLNLLAGGNEDVYTALNIPAGPEREALKVSAQEQVESQLIRNKAAASKVRRTLDTSVNSTDITSTLAWMDSANIGAEEGVLTTAEDLESTQKAIAMRIAADAKELMVQSQESGDTLSQSDANEQAATGLIDSGAFEVDIGEGTSFFGMKGRPEGHRAITGFGASLVPEKKATGKRSVQF